MKTDVIEFPIPAGHTANINEQSGKITITFNPVPQNVMERIKTIDDVLSALGEFDQDVKAYRKLLEVFGASSHITNNQLAVCITKALNEGWTPNWDNSSEYKYAPWFYMQSGSSGFRYLGYAYWRSYAFVGSRLCLKSSDLAKYAGTQFTEIYKQFML